MQEQLAIAAFGMIVSDAAETVRRYRGVFKDHMQVFIDEDVGVLKRSSMIAQRFDLCAHQHHSSLKCLEDLVIVKGAPVRTNFCIEFFFGHSLILSTEERLAKWRDAKAFLGFMGTHSSYPNFK